MANDKIIYSKKTIKNKASQRLMLKNGILYTISITQNKKHKFKNIKPFKVKKWIISNVLLHNFEIVDKAEIKKIIDKDPKEQQSYDRAFAMTLNEIYELNLTNKQYQTFTRFLQLYEIELKWLFRIQRKGRGLNTTIEYSTIDELIDEV